MNLVELAKQNYSPHSLAYHLNGETKKIKKKSIREAFLEPNEIPHKLNLVANVNGVDYINDSKSTNVNSLWYALEETKGPMILIAGGLDKGNDYSLLKKIAKKKVKALIILGLDYEKMHQAFGDLLERIYDAESMKQAVDYAFMIAKKGDTVLLSPGCASMDLFENYGDRGNQFIKYVKEL